MAGACRSGASRGFNRLQRRPAAGAGGKAKRAHLSWRYIPRGQMKPAHPTRAGPSDMSSDRPSPFRAPCPICSGQKILSLEDPSKLIGRIFKCAQCGSQLKPAYTWRVLLALPVLAASLAIFIVLVDALKRLNPSGLVLAGAIGGLGSLCFSLPVNVYMRGFNYRVISPPPNAP
jgi:hypothetical protein